MDIVDAKDKTSLFLQRVENVSTAGQPRLLSGGETAMDTTSAMLVVTFHDHGFHANNFHDHNFEFRKCRFQGFHDHSFS